jgi:hypothetical protein
MGPNGLRGEDRAHRSLGCRSWIARPIGVSKDPTEVDQKAGLSRNPVERAGRGDWSRTKGLRVGLSCKGLEVGIDSDNESRLPRRSLRVLAQWY